MGQLHCNSKRKKNKHLDYRERLRIEVLYKEGKNASLQIKSQWKNMGY
jgi:hypothetical protein